MRLARRTFRYHRNNRRSPITTGAAGGGDLAFNPLSIAPDLLFVGQDLNTLKQLSNGTIAVTADADPVGYWLDETPNAKTIAAAAGARPLYKTSGGLSWVRFDGVDDQLQGGVLSDVTAGTDFEIIMGFRFNTVATDSADYTLNDNAMASGGGFFSIGARSSNKVGCTAFDGGNRTVEDNYTVGQPSVISLRATAGVMTLQVNSRAPVTASLAGNGAIDSVAGGLLFGFFSTNFSDLDLFCFLSKKSVLTAEQRVSAMTWAARLSGTLL